MTADTTQEAPISAAALQAAEEINSIVWFSHSETMVIRMAKIIDAAIQAAVQSSDAALSVMEQSGQKAEEVDKVAGKP